MPLPRRLVTIHLHERHLDALGSLAGSRPWAEVIVDLVNKDVGEVGVREGAGIVVTPDDADSTLTVALPGDLLEATDRRRGMASLASYMLDLLEESTPSRPDPPTHHYHHQGGTMRSENAETDVRAPKPTSKPRPPAAPRVLDAETRNGSRVEFDRLRLRLRRGETPWPRVIIVSALDRAGAEEVRQALATELLGPGDSLRLLISMDRDLRVIGMDSVELAATWARLVTLLQAHAVEASIRIQPKTTTFGFEPDEELGGRVNQDQEGEDDDDDEQENEVAAVGVLHVELIALDPAEVPEGGSLHGLR